MEQRLFASHERQFATPCCAWHEVLATDTARVRNDAPRRAPWCSPSAQARAEGWCHLGEQTAQTVRLRTAGEPSQRFEVRALKRRPSNKRESSHNTETQPRLRPVMSTTRSTGPRTTMAQPPRTVATHPHENLAGSPAAGGRTARLSNGEEHELLRPRHADLRAA